MSSIAPEGEPRIKGAVLREFLLWYERRVEGTTHVATVTSTFPPEIAALVKPSMPAMGILASTWYPVALSHLFLDAMLAIEGCRDEGRDLAREANQDLVPKMIRGVYKVLYRTVASPELYARHVGRHWHKLHSSGERSFVIRAPGEGYSVVANWPGHHPTLCWITIYTMVSLFEMMGYEHVAAERTRCVSHGGVDCATVLRWR
jgi:hypothetical protein